MAFPKMAEVFRDWDDLLATAKRLESLDLATTIPNANTKNALRRTQSEELRRSSTSDAAAKCDGGVRYAVYPTFGSGGKLIVAKVVQISSGLSPPAEPEPEKEIKPERKMSQADPEIATVLAKAEVEGTGDDLSGTSPPAKPTKRSRDWSRFWRSLLGCCRCTDKAR